MTAREPDPIAPDRHRRCQSTVHVTECEPYEVERTGCRYWCSACDEYFGARDDRTTP